MKMTNEITVSKVGETGFAFVVKLASGKVDIYTTLKTAKTAVNKSISAAAKRALKKDTDIVATITKLINFTDEDEMEWDV